MGLNTRKPVVGVCKKNKGTDQHAQLPSQISAFIIRLLESVISRLATSELSIFLLVSVAEKTGLRIALSETPKTGFVALLPKFMDEFFCLCLGIIAYFK